MSRDAPVSFALVRNTVRYYVRQGRWAALARALWWTVVHLHGSELCEICGRPYVTWHARQDLWERVRSSSDGLLCPCCFERLAEQAGVRAIFVAEPWIVGGVRDEEIEVRVWDGFRYYRADAP